MSNEMISAIEQALLAMKRIYQAGYDRIIECGGSCDTPEYMMAGDPTAIELRALLAKPAEPVSPCAIADALESSRWPNTSIGNKVLVAAAITELRKAVQRQGAPVVLPQRDESLGTSERDEYANGYRHGWNAFHEATARLGPLYTRPAEQPEPISSTSDKYRAELYDEVWQLARDMGFGNVTDALMKLKKQPAPVAVVLPEPSCRQRLAAEGKPYPRSSCGVCGPFSPKWRECDSLLEVARLNPPQQ